MALRCGCGRPFNHETADPLTKKSTFEGEQLNLGASGTPLLAAAQGLVVGSHIAGVCCVPLTAAQGRGRAGFLQGLSDVTRWWCTQVEIEDREHSTNRRLGSAFTLRFRF